MDNQDSNKKRPFGRDDRNGRSFFRLRREETMRRNASDDDRKTTPAAAERSARPARQEHKSSASGYTKHKEERRRPDERRSRDDRPARYRNDRERQAKYKEATAPEMPAEMRLNRFIAMSGVCSRREADQLIEAGEVTVNGVRVEQLGTKVRPGEDEVRLNGELLKGERKVYIVLNKPKGYVTTLEDPHANRTVMELLKGECKERVYPVGRLDKNTTGVLLLTNDGNLTKELTHPSFSKKKIYHVFLDKACTEQDLERLAEGIELEDGPIHADEVSFVEGNRKEVGIELHSGRNRIVRRMFEALGYEVVKLDRVYFAGLTKMGLRRGFWRYLTPREVGILKSKSYD